MVSFNPITGQFTFLNPQDVIGVLPPQPWLSEWHISAKRSDGLSGTGAPWDPLNASTAAKFDAILAAHTEQGTCFRYSPSDPTDPTTWYLTTGGNRNNRPNAFSNVKHFGNGAILKLVNATGDYDGHVFTNGGARVDGFEVHDMLIDCDATNQPKWTNSAHGFIGAFYLHGSNNLIDSVHVIHFGTKSDECFPLFIQADDVTGDYSNNLVSNCRFDTPATGNTAGCTVPVVGFVPSATHSPTGSNNIVRKCHIDLTGSDFAYRQLAPCQLVEGCYIKGLDYGLYFEGADASGVPLVYTYCVFRLNEVVSCTNGARVTGAGNAPYIFFDDNKFVDCGSGPVVTSNDNLFTHYGTVAVRRNTFLNSDGSLTNNRFTVIQSTTNAIVEQNTADVHDLSHNNEVWVDAVNATVRENRTSAGRVLSYTFNGAVTPQMLFASPITWLSEFHLSANRNDGQPGTGAPWDPMDASNKQKFDALMASFGTFTAIRLGAGTFQTDALHTWVPKSGWDVKGLGRTISTIQMVGNLAGIHYAVPVISNAYNTQVDYCTFRDLCIDANYPGLANTIDNNSAAIRTFVTTATVTASPNVPATGGAFTVLDVGRIVTGTGIPANTYVGVATDTTHVGLSSSPVANVPVNVTIANGTTLSLREKLVDLIAISLRGSHNTYERVRVIGTAGNGQQSEEHFAMILGSSVNEDGVDNHMRYCLVENCYGTYGSPFALFGFAPGDSPSYPTTDTKIANSSVEFCTAIGRQGPIGIQKWNGSSYDPLPGSCTPFNSGGVNLAHVRDIKIHGCTFIDCLGIAYLDTNGYDGIEVSDNTLVRGWQGVAFVANPASFTFATYKNVKITGNRIGIQRRCLGGANYGLIIGGAYSHTDLTVGIPGVLVDGNTITYDATGPGDDVFWNMAMDGISGGNVVNNVTDDGYTRIGKNGVYSDPAGTNGTPDCRVRLAGNRKGDGSLQLGLLDSDSPSRVLTQFDKVGDVTPSNVPGLTKNLVAGRTYRFKAEIATLVSGSGGGIYTIAGGVTATHFRARAYYVSPDDGVYHEQQIDAIGDSPTEMDVDDNNPLTLTYEGVITVNAGGLFAVRFAQSIADGTSSILVGSTLMVQEIP